MFDLETIRRKNEAWALREMSESIKEIREVVYTDQEIENLQQGKLHFREAKGE